MANEKYTPLEGREIVRFITSRRLRAWASQLERDYPKTVNIDESLGCPINIALDLDCPNSLSQVNQSEQGKGIVIKDKQITLGYGIFGGYCIPRLESVTLPEAMQPNILHVRNTLVSIVKTSEQYYLNRILVLESGLQEWVMNQEDLKNGVRYVEVPQHIWKEMIQRYIKMKADE